MGLRLQEVACFQSLLNLPGSLRYRNTNLYVSAAQGDISPHVWGIAYCFNDCAEGMILMKTPGRQFRLDGTCHYVIYAGAEEKLSTQKYLEDCLSWPQWIIKKEEHYIRLVLPHVLNL